MRTCATILGVFALFCGGQAAAFAQNVAELIEQAHECDNMYTLGPERSQQKALDLYQAALEAGADEKQRLHILYRMAQLYGSAYELQKGEKPDFRKAIQLYERIIDSYSPEEPLVYKAMVSIGDHYTTLWEFEKALKWHKKALQYDTGPMAEELNTLKNKEMPRMQFTPDGPRPEPLTEEQLLELKKQHKRTRLLEKSLRKIKCYQEFAVDQVAYSAGLIDPLRAHGELRAVIDRHSGTFIAERAAERLKENMDRMPRLWEPKEDFPLPGNASLQPGGASASGISQTKHSIETPSDKVPVLTRQKVSLEPDTPGKTQENKHPAKEPRAPPVSYLSKLSIAAVALLFLVVAAVLIRNKVTSL